MSEQQQTQFLISYAIDRLTEYLIEDHNLTISQALQFVFNSETFEKLQETENGLYAQSPSYIYELLDREYQIGRI